MSQATAKALVPPRPNPGPEPWAGDGGRIGPLLILTLAASVLGAALLWRRRRKHPNRSAAAERPFDDSPEARLLALCEQLRGTLASRFGPGLRARTTEEIAVDPWIREHLGDERFDRLTEILRAGDRLKFAGQGDGGAIVDRLDEHAAWAASLASLPSPPRAVAITVTDKDRTRRPPGGRSGRRSPRSAPPRS